MNTAPDPSLADEVIERGLVERQRTATDEIARLVEATYTVIAETESLDPPIRAILTEAGLSNQAFYRHFRSKDELLVVVLDDGRRRLAAYLAHRMAGAASTDEQVAEWVRGVMAQAVDPEVAVRTRPFVVGGDRLHRRFPAEQERSEQLLIAPLADALGPAAPWAPTVYTTVMAALGRQLRHPAGDDEVDVDDLVRFVQRAVTASPPVRG